MIPEAKYCLGAIALLFGYIACGYALSPKQHTNELSLCQTLQISALDNCTSGYENKFMDEGGFNYDRETHIKDLALCHKLANNIYHDCVVKSNE